MKKYINLFIALLFIWVSKDFYTLDNAIAFMNGLPENSKAKAYVIALNSARSGVINGYYSVIYPQEN